MLSTLNILDTFLLDQNGIYLKDFHIQRTYESFQFLKNECDQNEITKIYNQIENELLNSFTSSLKVRLIFKNKNNFNYFSEPLDSINGPVRLMLLEKKDQIVGQGAQTFKWDDRSYWNQLLTLLQPGYDDILLINLNGHVTETSRFNLFAFDQSLDCVYTPTLQSGCLNGVFRRFCLFEKKIHLPELGYKKIVEKDISKNDLQNYQIYVGNSVRGVLKANFDPK